MGLLFHYWPDPHKLSVVPLKLKFITDVTSVYCMGLFPLVYTEWLSGSNQLNLPTVEFNLESTPKDNLGKILVWSNSTSLLLISIVISLWPSAKFQSKNLLLNFSMFQ